MIVAGVLATSVIAAATALFASDSKPGRSLLYVAQQWRRRHRHARLRNRAHPRPRVAEPSHANFEAYLRATPDASAR